MLLKFHYHFWIRTCGNAHQRKALSHNSQAGEQRARQYFAQFYTCRRRESELWSGERFGARVGARAAALVLGLAALSFLPWLTHSDSVAGSRGRRSLRSGCNQKVPWNTDNNTHTTPLCCTLCIKVGEQKRNSMDEKYQCVLLDETTFTIVRARTIDTFK